MLREDFHLYDFYVVETGVAGSLQFFDLNIVFLISPPNTSWRRAIVTFVEKLATITLTFVKLSCRQNQCWY